VIVSTCHCTQGHLSTRHGTERMPHLHSGFNFNQRASLILPFYTWLVFLLNKLRQTGDKSFSDEFID
jgi:hypothetical protein